MANMYTQVEFKGCDRLFNALVDSGNTFRNLISLRAFRCLNVKLLQCVFYIFSLYGDLASCHLQQIHYPGMHANIN
mgnify:CR=1 FL=1